MATENWTGTNGDNWSSQWTTSSQNGAVIDIQSNEGSLAIANTASSACGGIQDDTETAVEYLFKWRFTATAGRAYVRFIARGSGDFSATNYNVTDGYFLQKPSDLTDLVLREMSSGVESSNLGSVTLAADTNDRWIRWRLDGTSIKVRVWNDGSSEPGPWDIDITDSSHSSGQFQTCIWRGSGGDDARIDTWSSEDIGAVLPFTLTPNADGTRSAVLNEDTGTTDLYASVDDDPDSPTTSDWITPFDQDGHVWLDMTATPDNFGTVSSLEIRASVEALLFDTDTCNLYGQVFAANETTTYTDEVLFASQSDDGLVTASFTLNSTGTSASKSSWDTARVKLRWDYTA